MKLDAQINKSMVASQIYCKILLNISDMEDTFIKKVNFQIAMTLETLSFPSEIFNKLTHLTETHFKGSKRLFIQKTSYFCDF